MEALTDSVPVGEREPLPLTLCVELSVGLCVTDSVAVPQEVLEDDRLELCEGETVGDCVKVTLGQAEDERETLWLGEMVTDVVLHMVGVVLALPVVDWLPQVEALTDSVPVGEREPLPLTLCVELSVGLSVKDSVAVPQVVPEGVWLLLGECDKEPDAQPETLRVGEAVEDAVEHTDALVVPDALPHTVGEADTEGLSVAD